MATKWYRVKDKRTGHEYSVANVNENIHEVLTDKQASNSAGKPLPAKPKRNVQPLANGGGSTSTSTTSTATEDAGTSGAEAKKGASK